MGNIKPTKAALLLCDCLEEKDIEVVLQHWDGYKHIDLFIPKGKLYIEIDGPLHWLNAKQIISDFERDYHSINGGFKTLRVPSFIVLTETDKLTAAISEVLENMGN